MKKVFLLLLFSLSWISKAQTEIEKNVMKDGDFINYQKEMDKVMASETILKFDKVKQEINEGLNGLELSLDDFIDLDNWLSNNFSKTKFTTKEQAKSLFSEFSSLDKLLKNEMKLSNEYFIKLSKKYTSENIFNAYSFSKIKG